MSINIINRALIKLGQPPISSTRQEPYGQLMSLLYEDCKNLLLADHYWRFAIKRIVLAPDEEEPISGFAYAYTLPSDFLTLYGFGEYYKIPNYSDNIIKSDQRYSIEGNKILCDVADKLYISYVARIDDTKRFSPWFREALISRIASEAAMRAKLSPELQKMFSNEFIAYLERAEYNDEIMRDTETISDSSWVGVRGEYNTYEY